MSVQEGDRTQYYGLGLHRRSDLMGDYRLNQEENRTRINLKWPPGTQVVNFCPWELQRALLRRKSAKFTDQKIAEYLQVNFAVGIPLAQIVLGPAEDITQAAREIFKGKLYSPENLQKRNFWIRWWSKNCATKLETPPNDYDNKHAQSSKFPIGNEIAVHNTQGTIVLPDISLNREVTLADKQGLFTILGTHEMYPMPLGQYEFEITWEGIKIVKDFSACQEMAAQTIRIEMLSQVDPEAAELLAAEIERRRWAPMLKDLGKQS